MRISKPRHSFTDRLNISAVRFACIALLVGCAFSSGDVAHAQELARGEGVANRVRPEYDAMGIRLGPFVAYPAAEIRIGYDDNVLAEDSDARDDAVFILAPSLLLESDWTRHFLAFAVDSSSVFYATETDEQHTNWSVGGNGRLDLLASSDFTASIRFQGLTEERGSIDSIRVVQEPTKYDQFDVTASYNHRFNRVSASIGGNFTRLDFHDSPRVGGGTVKQDFRDRDIVRGVAQLGYELLPGRSAFIRGSINDRGYRESLPSVAFNRDSFGYEVVTGMSSGITNVIAGEIYVGYLDQDYDSSALRDIDGISFGMDLGWFVTEMTTLRATLSRDVVDSTTPGAGGALVSTALIGIDHELMRNVLLDGDLSYERGNFIGTSRNDDWIRAAVGVKYLVNRYVHLDLAYSLENRASNVTSLDYLRNRISMGFRGQF